MTCTVSSGAADANVCTAEQVEDVLAEVPVIEDLVEETLADVSDLGINENADVVFELETDDGSTVEIPGRGRQTNSPRSCSVTDRKGLKNLLSWRWA